MNKQLNNVTSACYWKTLWNGEKLGGNGEKGAILGKVIGKAISEEFHMWQNKPE